jgi:hypothetical protein
MPLTSGEACGTNADGSRHSDDCHHCYQNGRFVDELTMEQMVERCIPFAARQMDADKARAYFSEKLPTLKRWGNKR